MYVQIPDIHEVNGVKVKCFKYIKVSTLEEANRYKKRNNFFGVKIIPNIIKVNDDVKVLQLGDTIDKGEFSPECLLLCRHLGISTDGNHELFSSLLKGNYSSTSWHNFLKQASNDKRVKFLLQDEFHQMSVGNAPVSKTISSIFASHTKPTRINVARMSLFLRSIIVKCPQIFQSAIDEIKS
jgi:hypothetical protein